MGEPIKIYDLAVRMVELSGLSLKDESNPEGDIEIQITGLRPGEKLYEELLIGNEPHPTVHARIMRGSEGSLNIETLANNLEILKNLVAAQRFDLVQNFLVKNVIGYDPKKIVDWIFSSTN
ncbi:MAG: hypothetical protein CML33_08080 [Rhodobacteraceae bacterium]|nr:hypothetical protein [Paracoccaceae bacterium]